MEANECACAEGFEWVDQTSVALHEWGLEDCATKLLSLSENAVHSVTTQDGARYVLRLHRPGFREYHEIRSELEWLEALADGGVVRVARPVPNLRHDDLTVFRNSAGQTEYGVLLEFMPGRQMTEEAYPDSVGDVGSLVARLHRHSCAWERPHDFRRTTWTVDRLIGAGGDYGDWRDTRGLSGSDRRILEHAEFMMRREILGIPRNPRTVGLIHTDVRDDNLFTMDDGSLAVIDFDDCGFGYYLFDVACSFTFLEDRLDLDDMVARYMDGYLAERGVIAQSDFMHLPAFVLLRRLEMLAWMERRGETTYARSLKKTFADGTVDVASRYLTGALLPCMRSSSPRSLCELRMA